MGPALVAVVCMPPNPKTKKARPPGQYRLRFGPTHSGPHCVVLLRKDGGGAPSFHQIPLKKKAFIRSRRPPAPAGLHRLLRAPVRTVPRVEVASDELEEVRIFNSPTLASNPQAMIYLSGVLDY